MITKNDCYLLLNELKTSGEDVSSELTRFANNELSVVDIVQFINSRRQIDLCNFYEKLRHSYNKKRSPLYKNIVKEIEEPQEVLTTLSSLLTQALIFSKTLQDKSMFLQHSRCDEISKVLHNYFTTYDITNCIKLLHLIKADLKVLEESKK